MTRDWTTEDNSAEWARSRGRRALERAFDACLIVAGPWFADKWRGKVGAAFKRAQEGMDDEEREAIRRFNGDWIAKQRSPLA